MNHACFGVPFLLHALVFVFSLLYGNSGRVAVPAMAVYDAAGVLVEFQEVAPDLAGGESSPVQMAFAGLLPILCFMARFGLPVAPPSAFFVRAARMPRRADFWGLIPLSLAPPRPA